MKQTYKNRLGRIEGRLQDTETRPVIKYIEVIHPETKEVVEVISLPYRNAYGEWVKDEEPTFTTKQT